MQSFSSFFKETLLEFAMDPSMALMSQGSIDTIKHTKYKVKPGGNLGDPKGEIFMLMTPKQFYENEEEEGRLKKEDKSTLSENYWQDLVAMKYTSERDYKSWGDNVRNRMQIIKNIPNFNEEQLKTNVRTFNKMQKDAFDNYSGAYNSQTEKRFQAKREGAVQKNFKQDLFKELEGKNVLDDKVKSTYEVGLSLEHLQDSKFIKLLMKALQVEAGLIKGTYKDPAVNKPLLHGSAMMDGNLQVNDEQVLIDYIMGKDVPYDGIVRNIFKDNGEQLSKSEVKELFTAMGDEIKSLTDKGMDKEKAIKQVIGNYAKKSKDGGDAKEGELKYYFYDGVSKEASKFKQMSEEELIRRFKSFNKTVGSLQNSFKKSSFDPGKSLSQNQKMMKSMGALGKNKEIYDFTLPAYKGLVYMERPWKDVYGNMQKPGLAIINTCPSAALCKSFCYATKGFYTMYSSPSISAAQVLTYLVNHPVEFEKQVANYLSQLQSKSKKEVVIRWHDAGDFFSRSYYNMIMRIAAKTPDLLHYAYTKRVEMIHEVVTGKDFKGGKVQGLSKIPDNFVFNLSYGGTYDAKISKVPELAEFKFSKVIDLSIPVTEEYEHVMKRDVLDKSFVDKAHKLGDEYHNSVTVKTVTEKIKSLTHEGKVHKDVTVHKKVLEFHYIPKLAVLPAHTMEEFIKRNKEVLDTFHNLDHHSVFHKMFDEARGHQHSRVTFDEKWVKKNLSSEEKKKLEDQYPSLYKTYLPGPILEIYKKAIQKYYGFNKPILTYDEMVATPEDKSARNKYHVLVSTNDGDVSAQRRDMHGTLLVIH